MLPFLLLTLSFSRRETIRNRLPNFSFSLSSLCFFHRHTKILCVFTNTAVYCRQSVYSLIPSNVVYIMCSSDTRTKDGKGPLVVFEVIHDICGCVAFSFTSNIPERLRSLICSTPTLRPVIRLDSVYMFTISFLLVCTVDIFSSCQ